MNLLLDSVDTPFFTDLRATLLTLGVGAERFDWYLSDVETNHHPADVPVREGWWTGSELATLIANDDLQFIWCVLSAFPSGTRFDVPQPPRADGNASYWQLGQRLEPQLQGALFEIVSWDSSATLLIGLDAQLADHVLQSRPRAKRLECN